ncbi:MAG: nucleotidyl transferase AbiEii/AbiGii toxin family protein [Anaerolineaceae bacterium]|nr:nucleotidyl transferase AbiEii/AbiGii toxin family protein [Anaerolineaceae bacterium]
MKDFLHDIINNQTNPITKRNLVREYLQARILESLQRSEAMIPLAFQGGTALRFLFNIARFSEDLDFALERPSVNYDFRSYLKEIQSLFVAEGYNVQIKLNDQKTVHSAFVRFYGLLYELNLSPQPNEAFSVKIEVDTHPPEGAGLEIDLVRRFVPLRLQHYDRASLLSGKLHAILQRNYAKGRDLYDLMWYLSDPNWPEPNLVLLGNTLTQTHWAGSVPDRDNWRGIIYERLKSLNWNMALADVRSFLERPSEIELLTIANFKRLLRQTD